MCTAVDSAVRKASRTNNINLVHTSYEVQGYIMGAVHEMRGLGGAGGRASAKEGESSAK